MNRMELDDFCAQAGRNNGKDVDKWHCLNMASQITQSVMQGSRSVSRTTLSLATIAQDATRTTRTHGNVCGSVGRHSILLTEKAESW